MHQESEKETVNYLGREVPKNGFRTYIFNSDGTQKIAESWDEFEAYTHSDIWFATKEEAQNQKKPRKKTEG